jgi:predicted pyridoxine 5'-phosphate oxidase superfamily flavin-nucleotide-binding protein
MKTLPEAMKTPPEAPAACSLYHDGARAWQDRFDTRRLADRIEQRLVRDALDDGDRGFVERSALFFLATRDALGQPDVSYKGGRPGFVRVLDARTLAFPSYDGNGMYLSLGNISVEPRVALLFIDFERPSRLRIFGRASIDIDDPLLRDTPGAQLIVRVAVERVFPNCPRYIHPMQRLDISPYAPGDGQAPPVPAWKLSPTFCDVLPRDDPAAG